MIAGHVLTLRQRARDILIEWNDGTWQTSIQPAADLERAFAQVNEIARRRAMDTTETLARLADRVGTQPARDNAAAALRRARSIDPAPKVQEPAAQMAAE